MTAIPHPYSDSGLPGLLRLTPETRRLIYEHSGIASRNFYGQLVPAVYNLGDPSSFTAWRQAYGDDVGFQTFHGLLLSCRTVYAEAAALLYSANWFIVRYPPRRTLAALRALTPHALAHLTHLKVVLNQCACHDDKGIHEGSPECCGNKDRETPCRDGCSRVAHDPPLAGSVATSKVVSAEWNAAAAHLAESIVPGQLELSFVCDVARGDLEVARLMLDGLRQLPPLKDCHIRLCATHEPKLQQLAQEAALRARGITPLELPGRSSRAGSPSPRAPGPHFLILPPEVRLHILTYTDLVTPWKEVYWSRSLGYGISRASCEQAVTGNECPTEFHAGCQFVKCWETVRLHHPSIGCFCRQTHTAASSSCRCWAPPTAILLACRTLYSEATQVLYGQNRFIVIDSKNGFSPWPWPLREYRPRSFAASHFLRHVVPRHCLRHIRFLEVVFAPFTHVSRPRVGHPAFQDWDETMDWARHELNLPVLTMRLVVASLHGFDDRMTPEQGKLVLDTYNAILHPLRRLGPTSGGGLARFYAELAWPLSSPGRWQKPAGWLEGKERELKKRAEQYVMGNRYERVCVATEAPHESVWVRRGQQMERDVYY